MNLWLLPNVLCEKEYKMLPLMMDHAFLSSFNFIIAESDRGARTFLHHFDLQMPIFILSEHTTERELEDLCDHILQSQNAALISDAGLPTIADPGFKIVALAKKRGIKIKALPGPCSITQLLLLSGLSGQRFAFHGYPPVGEEDRLRWIQKIEKMAFEWKMVQLFIETPYRNQKLWDALCSILSPHTLVGFGTKLGSSEEKVEINKVINWNKTKLNKEPITFIVAKL